MSKYGEIHTMAEISHEKHGKKITITETISSVSNAPIHLLYARGNPNLAEKQEMLFELAIKLWQENRKPWYKKLFTRRKSNAE